MIRIIALEHVENWLGPVNKVTDLVLLLSYHIKISRFSIPIIAYPSQIPHLDIIRFASSFRIDEDDPTGSPVCMFPPLSMARDSIRRFFPF